VLTSIFEPSHLIIVLAIALLVLGPKRLPGAGRALGHGLREFRSSVVGAGDDAPPRRVPASEEDESSHGSSPA
jgi:sec-independent protein translocase protein TatA